MSRRNRIFWKALLPLGLLAVAVAVFRRKPDHWEYADEPEVEEALAPVATPHTEHRRPAARFAATAAFTMLFFAGASFTAGAGDRMARLLENDVEAVGEAGEIAAAVESVAEAAPALVPEAEPAPEVVVEPEAAVESMEPVEVVTEQVSAAAEPTGAVEAEAADAAVAQPVAPAPSNVTAPAAAPAAEAPAVAPAPAPSVQKVETRKWVVARAAAKPARAPELEHEGDASYGEPTVWLNRALPDPTPASARLARSFARDLASVSARHGADWAAVLGVLRAQGERGAVPASRAELATLAKRLAGDSWKGALAISGRTAFADRAVALADLYRSVGIEALVTGFAAAKERLTERLLEAEGVLIYPGGRSDLEAGRIDVRLIVLIGYLAERHGSVTVSSLFSGHRKYARPGVVSAHTYGHAVDLAAVGGIPIAGHQQPGGLTEAAVRSVLLLPAELQPQQVISLLGLGGPSFPLRDHGDHIHVGY